MIEVYPRIYRQQAHRPRKQNLISRDRAICLPYYEAQIFFVAFADELRACLPGRAPLSLILEIRDAL